MRDRFSWKAARRLTAAFLLAATVSPVAAHEGGHGNEMMWQACEGRALNDSCSFENSAHQINRGSCQMMVENLICVRNQPLENASVSKAVQAADMPEAKPAPVEDSFPLGWLAIIPAGVMAGGALLLRFRRAAKEPEKTAD